MMSYVTVKDRAESVKAIARQYGDIRSCVFRKKFSSEVYEFSVHASGPAYMGIICDVNDWALTRGGKRVHSSCGRAAWITDDKLCTITVKHAHFGATVTIEMDFHRAPSEKALASVWVQPPANCDTVDSRRQIMDNNIKVGQGCSYGVGSDCYPCTITQISASGKKLKTRDAHGVLVSGSVQDGSAEYKFDVNPNGIEREWSLRKDGRFWQVGGHHTLLGTGGYAKRYDPHF